jgi:hypothetical protein
MRMKKIVVFCAALTVGSTLSMNAQQLEWKPAGAKAQGGGRAAAISPSEAGPLDFYTYALARPVESQLIKGQPYSAEITTEKIQTLGDGNRIVQKTTGRVYRDVEGRVRREEDRPSGAPMITITDPVANVSITLDTVNKIARESQGLRYTIGYFGDYEANRLTISEKPAQAAGGARGGRGGSPTAAAGAPVAAAPTGSARGAGGGGRGGAAAGVPENRDFARQSVAGTVTMRRDAGVVEQLSNKSIEGVLCSGVRRTTTIEKGTIGNEQPIKIVSEEWTSVDLQVLVLTDHNDPRTGRSTYKLTRIIRADPDLMLFRAPADYTVTKIGGRGRGGN